MTRAAAQALGLGLFAAPGRSLTAIMPPNGLDSGIIVKDLRQRFDAVVADGQGDMKGKLFRVAHIGYYDYLDTVGIIGAIEHAVAKAIRPASFEFGAALRAAQLVYAKETAEAKTQGA